jgi:hypothetical protein
MSLYIINHLEFEFAKQNTSCEVGILYFSITKKNNLAQSRIYAESLLNLIYNTRNAIFQRISIAAVVLMTSTLRDL